MGLFSKIWKGIKKVGKKIAKGVKKTFKKIGAAIGKLGVVGQIGMMFLMPYAMGALSSFADWDLEIDLTDSSKKYIVPPAPKKVTPILGPAILCI